MHSRLDPRLDVLPEAQRLIWPELQATRDLSFVLYGGTAVALHLGHRQSEDFDFFRSQPVSPDELLQMPLLRDATILQEQPNTFVVSVRRSQAGIRISFFGALRFGTIKPPFETSDGVLLVASREDLLATKLKAILGRAEAKDYVDIAALLRAGTSLPRALSGFRAMYGGEPATVLRAIGYFEDGDVAAIPEEEKRLLRSARDGVKELPDVSVTPGALDRL